MFPSMDPWEIALWLVATYLAVVSLVRLMAHHRDRLVARRHALSESILARKRRAAAAKRQLRRHDPAR